MRQQKFDYYTLRHSKWFGGVDVLGWGTYPDSSVLAGQPMKVFLGSFDTEQAALAEYPKAQWSHTLSEPQVNLSHLPGENDMVPGGALPDDIDDGY